MEVSSIRDTPSSLEALVLHETPDVLWPADFDPQRQAEAARHWGGKHPGGAPKRDVFAGEKGGGGSRFFSGISGDFASFSGILEILPALNVPLSMKNSFSRLKYKVKSI